MKLKLRKKLSDYTITEWSDVMVIAEKYQDKMDSEIEIEDKLAIISIMCRVPYDSLLVGSMKDINRALKKCIDLMSTYEKKLPLDSIQIQGVWYDRIRLEKGKIQGGWFVDVNCMFKDFKSNPALIVALNYVERGKRYAEQDENGFIINSVKDRADIFKDHFPADVFIDTSTFFLDIYLHWRQSTLDKGMKQTEKGLAKIRKEMEHIIGSDSSTK